MTGDINIFFFWKWAHWWRHRHRLDRFRFQNFQSPVSICCLLETMPICKYCFGRKTRKIFQYVVCQESGTWHVTLIQRRLNVERRCINNMCSLGLLWNYEEQGPWWYTDSFNHSLFMYVIIPFSIRWVSCNQKFDIFRSCITTVFTLNIQIP